MGPVLIVDDAPPDLAAPMHDTGKLGIPDIILGKPGRLDAGEWSVVKTHTRIGFDILARAGRRYFRWRPRSPRAITKNGTAVAIRTG